MMVCDAFIWRNDGCSWLYKNLVPDAIDCVNIMFPAVAISVENNVPAEESANHWAESLIVGPVFSKHIGPGKVLCSGLIIDRVV